MNDVHMLRSKHPIFQSLWSHWNTLEFLSVDGLSSPFTRTRVANRSLSSSEPICSLWQLSHSLWILLDDPSLLQREMSPCFSFYSLIPVLLFTLVFKSQYTCSFPMHHCTDVIWPYPWYADAVLYFVMFPVFCLFYHGYIPILLVQVTNSCLLFKNHIIQYF